MKCTKVILNNGRETFIRLPETIDNQSILTVAMPAEIAGKTIRISILDNDDESIPFSTEVIGAVEEKAIMTYYGDIAYWVPQEVSKTVVEEMPTCDWGSCNSSCHDVTCPIHYGVISAHPKQIKYVRSERKPTND